MGQPNPPLTSVYDLGDLIQLRATYLSTDGITPADPSTVTFLAKAPNGSVATYVYGQAGGSIIRVATGGYTREIIACQAGSWFYRSEGTGGVIATDEWTFIVAASFIL